MEMESYLEDVMPEEEIPPGKRVAANISQIKPITHKQKDMLVSLFDDLTIMHERLGHVAGMMSSLCKVMAPKQLMLVMKCSVCPLIQLMASPGLFDLLIQKERKELPDDKRKRIKEP